MYVITDKCVSCGSCADACPNEAIVEGADHYEINTDLCVECGTCQGECPNDAIEEEFVDVKHCMVHVDPKKIDA